MVYQEFLDTVKDKGQRLARSLSRSRSRSRSERPDGVASVAASSSQSLDAHDGCDAATDNKPLPITTDQPRDATQGRLTDLASSSEHDTPDDSTETAETLWNEALRKFQADPHDKFLQDIKQMNKQRIGDGSGHGSDTADSSPPPVSMLVMDVLHEIEQQQLKRNARRPEWLQPTVEVLNKLASVGDVLVSIDPLHAAPPWAAVKTVLVVLTSEHHLGEKTDQGIALIASLFALCTLYIDLYLRGELHPAAAGPRQDLRGAVVDSYCAALQFLRDVKHMNDRHPASRALRAPVEVLKIDDRLASLKTSEQQLEDSADRLEKIGAAKGREDIVNALRLMSSQYQLQQHICDLLLESRVRSEFNRVRSELNPVMAALHNANERDASTCLPNTRVALLSEVTQWAEDSQGPNTYWVSGMAGTGKSTISRSIAHLLRDKNILGGSFFFKKGRAGRDETEPFLKTVAYQLARHFIHWHKYLSDSLERDGDFVGGTNNVLFQKLIAEPLDRERRHAAAAGKPMKPAIIVIDALDECVDKDIEAIVQQLATASIRLFITAKPDTYIQPVLTDSNSELCLLHHLDQQVVKADIKLYLTLEITQFRNEYNENYPGKHMVLPEGWPHQNALDRLTDAASPLFIVAATMCRMLAEDDWDVSPQAKIQYFLDRQDHGAELCMSLYSDILLTSKLEGSFGDLKSRGERFRKIVGPIVFLCSPLGLRPLCRLLRLDMHDMVPAIRRYRSVIDIPRDLESDAPVKLLHLSFRDFVLSEHAPQDFRIDERAAHGELAQLCLQVLMDQLRPDICGIGSPGKRRADIAETVVREHMSQELQYACRHWVFHLVQSHAEIDDYHVAFEVLHQKLLQWLEVLSLLGDIFEAPRQIKHLRTIVCGENSRIDELLREAHHFTVDFRHMINESPLQVYYSALMFSPPSFKNRKLFDHQGLADTMLERYSVPERWNNAPVERRLGAKPTSGFGLLSDGRVVAAHQDGTVQVLDPTTGAELHKTRLDHVNFRDVVRRFPPKTMVMCRNLRLVVHFDSIVELWNLEDGSWQGLTSSRHVASVSTDGDQVFVLCQPMNTVSSSSSAPFGLACSSGLGPSSSGSSPSEDPETYRALSTPIGLVGSPAVATPPIGSPPTLSRRSVTGLLAPKLMVFEANTGQQVRDDFVSFASESAATRSRFEISRTSHSGTWTVWSYDRQSIMVTWHHGPAQRTWELERSTYPVKALELSPDSKVLGMIRSSTIAVWDAETWCLKGTYNFPVSYLRCLVLSKAHLVVLGRTTGSDHHDAIAVWELQQSRPAVLNVPNNGRRLSIWSMALRQGGDEIACLGLSEQNPATAEATTLMYDLYNLKPESRIRNKWAYQLQTGFNNAFLVVHSRRKMARGDLTTCEVRDAEGLLIFERDEANIIAVAQDAPFIAVGDGSTLSDDIQVFNGLDGSLISRMKTKFHLRALCFINDGSRLASLSLKSDNDRFPIDVYSTWRHGRPRFIQFAVQLWNVNTGLCEWEKIVETPTLDSRTSYQLAAWSNSMETYVAFAYGQRLPIPAPRVPEGRESSSTLLSTSRDRRRYAAGAISVLGMQSDTEYEVQTNSVSSMAFSRDGSHLMVRLQQGLRFLIDPTTGEATMHVWSQPQSDSTHTTHSPALTLTRTPSIFEFLAETTQSDGPLGLSDDGRWIVRDGERMLRIPDMHRATNVAVLGSCVFVTTEQSLMIFKFKPRGETQAPRIG